MANQNEKLKSGYYAYTDYIRKIAKQKPNKQSILSQLQKKEQCKDLALSCLGEEIDTYLSTGKLCVKSPKVICKLYGKLYVKSDSLFVSENVDTPTKDLTI